MSAHEEFLQDLDVLHDDLNKGKRAVRAASYGRQGVKLADVDVAYIETLKCMCLDIVEKLDGMK